MVDAGILTIEKEKENRMKVATAQIILDNDAFLENEEFEVVRIFREMADRFEVIGLFDHVLRDINGNKVGRFSVAVNKDATV
jgi:hypothetical protein